MINKSFKEQGAMEFISKYL